MKNIEIFHALSGLLLADLYEHFPLKINVRAADLAIRLDDEFWDSSQLPDENLPNCSTYIRHHSPAGLAKPTIEWLASAGLITYNGMRDGAFEDVCLTARGLEVVSTKSGLAVKALAAVKELTVESGKESAREYLRALGSEAVRWCAEKTPLIMQMVVNSTS